MQMRDSSVESPLPRKGRQDKRGGLGRPLFWPLTNPVHVIPLSEPDPHNGDMCSEALSTISTRFRDAVHPYGQGLTRPCPERSARGFISAGVELNTLMTNAIVHTQPGLYGYAGAPS